MANLNCFAISAALGATIGPRSRIPGGPSRFREATAEMAVVLAKRQAHLEVLHARGGATVQYISRIKRAFVAVRDGYSPDRVVADPRLNRAFLSHCEAFGLDDKAANLNRALLNLRKAGELTGLHSRKSVVPDQWRYSFASEIAARSMYYRYGISVDQLICDPCYVREFDALARRMARGFTPFEYRWAALNIRKKGLTATNFDIELDEVRWSPPIHLTSLQKVPDTRGIYVLWENETALYIANSEDLRESAESQRQLVHVRILGRDLWNPNPRRMFWKYAAMPDVPSTLRYNLVNELVLELQPVFNIPRQKAA